DMKINRGSFLFRGIFLLFLFASMLKGQELNSGNDYNLQDPIKTKQSRSGKQRSILAPNRKNYLLAAAETFGMNMLVWSYDRYIKNKTWAYISCQSIKNNLRHGFVWDSDGFATNQFFHPYSGALSFTSARANGIGFWHSVIYSFAGSLMWELAMENEYPSANDIITTPSSGIVLGEISYRVSSLFLDENSKGLERVFREMTAALLCPMHGVNRLLMGKTWKTKQKHDRSNYLPVLSFGINRVFIDQDAAQKQLHNFVKFDLKYGELLSGTVPKKPFDYFTVNTGLSLSRTNSIIEIYGTGMLWGRNLTMLPERWGVFGIFKNFDILYNETYKISASSVGSGVIIKAPISPKIRLDNSVILSGVILGGVNSVETVTEDNRDYNIGHGVNGRFEFSFAVKNVAKIYLSYNRYWFHTFVGTEGDELIGIMTGGSQLKIFGPVSLAMEYIYYDRHGEYIGYPSVRKNNFALRSYLSYEF
ncbi:DUF3943 domain-containing protein, partial [candidate division KSB1 bacterium]|nr:DUF3943 domain-containing protein [candidate division KSB1 bacterium]